VEDGTAKAVELIRARRLWTGGASLILLKRPVGRPPQEVRRYYANFSYQAASWTKPRRVVAKVV
jgi:hypothetical protein